MNVKKKKQETDKCVTDSKAFKENYQKIATIQYHEQIKELEDHFSEIMSLHIGTSAEDVNPLIDTLDLLHI